MEWSAHVMLSTADSNSNELPIPFYTVDKNRDELPIACYLLLIAVRWTTHNMPSTADCKLLLIASYLLLTASYLLLTASYLLLIASYLLLIASYLLLIAIGMNCSYHSILLIENRKKRAHVTNVVESTNACGRFWDNHFFNVTLLQQNNNVTSNALLLFPHR